MGIKVITLMMCVSTGKPVTIHASRNTENSKDREGKVFMSFKERRCEFSLEYLDTPGIRHPICFDQCGQGYVQDAGTVSEIDEADEVFVCA
jgi:hypothetical protein